jgi:hypothetical protein
MKLITILGGIVAVAGLVLFVVPTTQEYVTERVVVEEKTVEVDTLQKRIEDAQAAAQASTTEKAQAAYDAVLKEEAARIELEIRKAYRKELETKEIELEKQSGF